MLDIDGYYVYLLLCEDGSYMVLENYIEQLTDAILTLENGSSLLLEDGYKIILER